MGTCLADLTWQAKTNSHTATKFKKSQTCELLAATTFAIFSLPFIAPSQTKCTKAELTDICWF
jgi:hypothetical protein